MLAALGALGVAGLLLWSLFPASSKQSDELVFVHLGSSDRAEAAARLASAGVLDDPWLLRLYWALLLPTVKLEAGEHLLREGLTPRELSQRLARLPRRPTSRVTIPEGWHRKRIAARLEKAEICRAATFLRATEDAELLERLEVAAASAEGYLFPATYELPHDMPASEVVARMVKEGQKRLQALLARHPGALDRLRRIHGFGERELLILASIVEKETPHASERPLVASVYLNRLAQPGGETRGRLQSDPTAVYGCEYEPERAPSCAGFDGRVRPEMLRDAENRYNTYRHAHLPPGPIASPGIAALEAVLTAEASDYLYFVADGSGRHTFSRSFDEHKLAVSRLRAARGATPELDEGAPPVPADAPRATAAD